MTLKTERCCPSSGVEAILDYSVAGSAKSFLERTGAFPATRNPLPRTSPGWYRVHQIPLTPPLPLPELQSHFVGEPPPDQGQTLDWPHPDLKAAEELRDE